MRKVIKSPKKESAFFSFITDVILPKQNFALPAYNIVIPGLKIMLPVMVMVKDSAVTGI